MRQQTKSLFLTVSVQQAAREASQVVQIAPLLDLPLTL